MQTDVDTHQPSVAQTEHAVLIAGGGPTGMMLAAELALAGADAALLERRADHVLAGSRAGGIHSRTIEVLDQRGVADRFSEALISVYGTAAVHTEVERQSRYMIARIPSKTAEETLTAMLAIFGEIPEQLRKDTDARQRHRVRQAHRTARSHHDYFARPYHSWERGSNENINGYLRRFFPKGTDFDQVTQAELDQAVELINNNMPRRCLDWQTAAEAWATGPLAVKGAREQRPPRPAQVTRRARC